ncbi:MAG: CBS domain-containing protein [Pyrinomonadaceae bacterium]
MARYRNEQDDDRDRELYAREERNRREMPSGYDDQYTNRRGLENERRPEYNRGRFGERAEYEHDEPRFSDPRDRFRDQDYRDSSVERGRDSSRQGTRGYYGNERSRLRCRDVMTRDLVVATRDTSLREVAIMMKQEDTGVIPVVEYDAAGNGRAASDERNYDTRGFSRGKLVGLLTDRDIIIRAIAEDKDCATTRAEEVMSTDIHTARPNDRVVEVIRKMGDKQVRRIPVVSENGYLQGMISMADVAVETEEDRELADALQDISKGSSFWNRLFT